MARVIKSFETEEEYQEWVNSPYMRTPYTCLVKETGQTHYFDGDDNDYSITVVVGKTGWICPFTQVAYRRNYDIHFYINGELLDEETDNRIVDGYTWRGRYYSNKFRDADDDFRYKCDVIGEENDEAWYRGAEYRNKQVHEGCPDYFYPHKLGRSIRFTLKKYIYCQKDDVLKIEINIHRIPIERFWGYEYREFTESVSMRGLFHNAKEVIFGDGWTKFSYYLNDNNDTGKPYKSVRKVFFGKNMRRIYVNFLGKDERRSKIYFRKNPSTQINFERITPIYLG